jgi:3',5'-cyclic AMP phosphodiesterase CpdA
MSLLVVSDLHAHSAHQFTRRLPDGTDTRFQDILSVFRQTEAYLDQYRPTHLILLGDLTHRRHAISFALYNPLVDSIERLVKRCVGVILVTGNHDLESDQHNALHPLGLIPGVQVVEEPMSLPLPLGGGYFIPYSYDEPSVVKAFDAAPSDVPLFAHFAASGVQLEDDYRLDSVVHAGTLSRFPYVVFGHVHRPSTACAGCGDLPLDAVSGPCPTCQKSTGRIIYVGAPLHFTFGDQGPRFGLLIQDDGTKVRLPFAFPPFVTGTWPRVAKPATPGYLRLRGVPADRLLEARERALALGWLDVATQEAETPKGVFETASAGLEITPAWLESYVTEQRPGLDPDGRAALVEEGWRWLRG